MCQVGIRQPQHTLHLYSFWDLAAVIIKNHVNDVQWHYKRPTKHKTKQNPSSSNNRSLEGGWFGRTMHDIPPMSVFELYRSLIFVLLWIWCCARERRKRRKLTEMRRWTTRSNGMACLAASLDQWGGGISELFSCPRLETSLVLKIHNRPYRV